MLETMPTSTLPLATSATPPPIADARVSFGRMVSVKPISSIMRAMARPAEPPPEVGSAVGIRAVVQAVRQKY